MATVGFQLTAAPDPLATQVNPNATTTSTNSTQAQGAPVPQDTVTLTGQVAEGQGTNNQPNPPSFAPLALQPAGTNTGTTQGSNTSPADAQQTQQQELQQLEQTLQQLGIDPQSISLFNQLALLAFANDPAALQQFVQQLQQSTQQIVLQGVSGAQTPASGQPGVNASGTNQGQQTADPGAATPLQPAQANQVQGPAPAAPTQNQAATGTSSLSPGFTVASAASQSGASAAAAAGSTSNFLSQFQVLQSTVAAIEAQPVTAPAANGATQAAAINVTI